MNVSNGILNLLYKVIIEKPRKIVKNSEKYFREKILWMISYKIYTESNHKRQLKIMEQSI